MNVSFDKSSGRAWVRGEVGDKFMSAVYNGSSWSWGAPDADDLKDNFVRVSADTDVNHWSNLALKASSVTPDLVK